MRGKVWRMAWPTITEQCLNLTVGLNEVFLVGHLSKEAGARLGYDSAQGLAAVSLGQFFNWIALAAFNGIGIATTALVARSIGAKEPQKGIVYGRQALLMAFGLGVFMSLVLYFAGPFMLFLLGADGQLMEIGTTFVHTTALGMPFFALLVAGNGCLRGKGDTRTPLIVMLLVNVTNIAVAWLLVNGQFGLPALGVEGAALGAVTSWAIGSVLVVSKLLFGLRIGPSNRDFRIPLSLKFNREAAGAIFSQGLPTVAEQWTFQVGIFFFARILVSQGTVIYAGHNAIINIDSISFLPGIGLGIANTVLVGQALGAGKPEEAELYAKTAYKMGLFFMTIMGGTFFFFPEFFLGLLIGDPRVIAAATPGLRIAGLFDPLVGTGFILTGALRGAGDTRFPLYVRMLSSIVVRVSLGYLFMQVLGLGLLGGRLAMGADTTLLAALVIWRFRSGRWKTIWQERANRRLGHGLGHQAARNIEEPQIKPALAGGQPALVSTRSGFGATSTSPAPQAAMSAPDAD